MVKHMQAGEQVVGRPAVPLDEWFLLFRHKQLVEKPGTMKYEVILDQGMFILDVYLIR
jgi:hypothetical protein